jgi:alginate O-acetyltransferase complex protein AlgI
MNFADLRFWECLAVSLGFAAAVHLVFRRHPALREGRFDRVFLLLLGLILLGMVSWISFIIHFVIAGLTYGIVRWGTGRPASQGYWILVALVPLQFIPLVWYKYAGFIAHDLFGRPVSSATQTLIPAGISFYTFQLVGFAVDTLIRRNPVPGFFDFFNFAGFFPQIVAGPIERRDDLLPQIQSFRLRWSASDIDAGFRWMALGLFFKCALADTLAEHFHRAATSNAWLIWLANILFGLRIYYDFAGYSLIAIGIAQCLGIRLSMNFLSPYCSTSPAEFWRRWHVTLSHWFRDYLYLPLGGSRTRLWALNIALVFLVSGLWHGAGWNFLLWGCLHAALLIGQRLTRSIPIPSPLGWLGTLTAVLFSWLLFYETDTATLSLKLHTLITPSAYGANQFREILTVYSSGDLVALIGILGMSAATLAAEAWSLKKYNQPYACLTTPRTLTLLVILTLLLAPGKNNGFIYFAF